MKRFGKSLVALAVTVGSQSGYAVITPDFEIICRTTEAPVMTVELNLKHRHIDPMAGPQLFGGAYITSDEPDFLYESFPIKTRFQYDEVRISGDGGVTEPLEYVVETSSSLFEIGKHADVLLKIVSYPPQSRPVTKKMMMNCFTKIPRDLIH